MGKAPGLVTGISAIDIPILRSSQEAPAHIQPDQRRVLPPSQKLVLLAKRSGMRICQRLHETPG